MNTDSLQRYVQLREQLREQRTTLLSRIEQINEALGTVAPVAKSVVEGAADTGAATGRKGKRTMSPEARALIAAAQRARWAKQKGQKPVSGKSTANGAMNEEKPKRKMSAAGRKAISEAAKRRWAATRVVRKDRL